MRTIAIGKIGKSILFGASSGKNMTGGAIDADLVFSSLLKTAKSDDTFLLVGRSNWSRLKEHERQDLTKNNVIDIWEGFKEWEAVNKGVPSFEYVNEWLKEHDVRPDEGLFIAGNIINGTIVGRKTGKDKFVKKALMASDRYTAPVHHFINETKIPYALIVTDPRCFPEPCLELSTPPKFVITQLNETIDFEHIISYESEETQNTELQCFYSGVESLYTIDTREQLSFSFEDDPDRDIDMLLFLNQGKPSRYPFVKDMIIDHFPDAKIYGKWDKKILENNDQIENIPMSELTHIFDRIKYTLCIPIKGGWATGKFWEMSKLGILPFVTHDYDEQDNIGIPSYLRVSSGQELKDKIEELNREPHKYNSLIDEVESIRAQKNSLESLGNMLHENIERLYDYNNET